MKTQGNYGKSDEALDAVIFDCDSTLSALEAIDRLAELNGQQEEVASLTRVAMSDTGLTPELYERRLSLVKPSLAQVNLIGKEYCERVTPGAKEVIKILQRLGKQVFIFSAGVNPAVTAFGEWLGVARANIFAVDLVFVDGAYQDFDRNSPLTANNGKKILACQLQSQYPRLALVGDGMNDASVAGTVCQFVGFGGVVYREQVRALAARYLRTNSLWPVLGEWLTEAELQLLTGEESQQFKSACAREGGTN